MEVNIKDIYKSQFRIQKRKLGVMYIEPTQYPVKEQRVNNILSIFLYYNTFKER